MTLPRLALLLLAALVLPAEAICRQRLESRIAAAPPGSVRMTFAARPGICGDGPDLQWPRPTEDWEPVCEGGPVRVRLTMLRGEVVDVRTHVGGRWRAADESVTDLGRVPAAAAYLVALAESTTTVVGRKAVLPAVLADSAVVGPALLRIAADDTRPRTVRRETLRWAAMLASHALGEGAITGANADTVAIRTHAVFALSQLANNEGVPALVRVARTHADPRVRAKALFWLGQTGDARAIPVLREVLQAR